LDLQALLTSLDDRYAESFREGDVHALPGVSTALRFAEELGWLNALQTGNTPTRAQAKLQSVGLWTHFARGFGSFGNLAGDRSELVNRARLFATERFQAETPLLLVGDTPRDAEAANRNGIPMLGVQTGGFSEQALRLAGATHVVGDLRTGAATFQRLVADGPGAEAVGI